MGLFALICRYLIAIRWGSCVHRRFTRTFALRYVTLEIVTLRERSTTMVDKTAAGSQQTDQRDADTRDSLAALARRRSNSSPIVLQSDVQAAPQEKQEKQEKQSEAGSALQTGEDANDDANRAEESQTVKEKDAVDGPDNTQQPQMASISAITTQVLPPSFIPTATGRIRPVTGAFPQFSPLRRRNRRSAGDPSARWPRGRCVEPTSAMLKRPAMWGARVVPDGRRGMTIRRRRESPAVLPIMRIDQWTDQNGQRNKSVGILDIHAVHARYARFALHCTSLYYVIPIESQQCV